MNRGQTNRLLVELIFGQDNTKTNRITDEWRTDIEVDRWMNGKIDNGMDGWTDRQRDKFMVRCTDKNIFRILLCVKEEQRLYVRRHLLSK
jgi:hypothetical protein